MGKAEVDYEQLIEVGLSADLGEFQRRLVGIADRMGFPLVTGVLMKGVVRDSGVVITAVANTPSGFAEVSQSTATARRDPVMNQMMSSAVPFVWDQQTYVDSGAGELWDRAAPFGYRTGIALALHLPDSRRFLLGVDREEALPKQANRRMQLLAQLQLVAVHSQAAAERLMSPVKTSEGMPKLTARERDVLGWTEQGKTAWEIAQILRMSEKTVNFHLGNAMRKLQVNSKHQAVLKCLAAGWL